MVLAVGLILTFTSLVLLAARVSIFSGSKVTSHPDGAPLMRDVKLIFSITELPLFFTLTLKKLSLDSVICPLSTPSGVLKSIEKRDVMTTLTLSSDLTSSEATLKVMVYSPGSGRAKILGVTLSFTVS